MKNCSIVLCDNKHYARGYCTKHYYRLKRHGSPHSVDKSRGGGYRESSVKHGMRGTREYISWRSMRDRCLNSSSPAYKNYGGRGISICPEWEDFSVFYNDMGERPVGTSLDRIDVDGNYCKDNCRWATAKQQANNRRRLAGNTGVYGVHIKKGRYVAVYKGVSVGSFDSVDDAQQAWDFADRYGLEVAIERRNKRTKEKYQGICFVKSHNAYRVSYVVDGIKRYKYFKDIDMAHEFRNKITEG